MGVTKPKDAYRKMTLLTKSHYSVGSMEQRRCWAFFLQTWQWNGNIGELYYEIVNPFVSRISAIGCKLYLGSNRRGKLVLRLRRQPICLKLLFQGGWYPFEVVTLSERPVLSVWILSIFPVRSCAKLCVSNSVSWMGDAYKLDVRNCTMRSH